MAMERQRKSDYRVIKGLAEKLDSEAPHESGHLFRVLARIEFSRGRIDTAHDLSLRALASYERVLDTNPEDATFLALASAAARESGNIYKSIEYHRRERVALLAEYPEVKAQLEAENMSVAGKGNSARDAAYEAGVEDARPSSAEIVAISKANLRGAELALCFSAADALETNGYGYTATKLESVMLSMVDREYPSNFIPKRD